MHMAIFPLCILVWPNISATLLALSFFHSRRHFLIVYGHRWTDFSAHQLDTPSCSSLILENMLLRRWRGKILLSCTIVLAFTTVWLLMTVLLLTAQEQYLNRERESAREKRGGKSDDDFERPRGIQVVVGHYQGKIGDTPKKNLSQDILDSNNYDPLPGYGENGRAVKLDAADESRAKDLFQINQFNIVASDRIALNRSLADMRKKSCRAKVYDRDLPTTSVVIVYHNEAWSTLLRTVTSVILRSPERLLKEIILVDDFSTRAFLGEPLEKYVAGLGVTIKIVRARERVGLIRARLMGAAEATGDVLTFLDSHCECTQGWLEPLLARIKEDRTVAICPIIDVINDKSMAYQKGIELFRGGFNWNLQFRWYSVSPAELQRRNGDGALPIRSPTMAGGLFSINREYFYEVGSYDEHMDIWGGENLEMSFRIWQCGGKVEIHPCSHVGHIFRKASPHDFPDNGSSRILNTNLVRVAEVWMDQWKHVFYKTAPQAAKLADSVDVSERKELRRRLQCKSFRWYLDKVWPEHFLPMDDQFFGRIKQRASGRCLQLTYVAASIGFGTEKRISSEPCTDGFSKIQIEHAISSTCVVSTPTAPGKRQHSLSMQRCTLGFDMWQLWVFVNGSIKGDEHQCLGATEISGTWLVQLKECSEGEREKWTYSHKTYTLQHRQSGLCLERPRNENGAKDEVHLPLLQRCKTHKDQYWSLSPVEWKPENVQ